MLIGACFPFGLLLPVWRALLWFPAGFIHVLSCVGRLPFLLLAPLAGRVACGSLLRVLGSFSPCLSSCRAAPGWLVVDLSLWRAPFSSLHSVSSLGPVSVGPGSCVTSSSLVFGPSARWLAHFLSLSFVISVRVLLFALWCRRVWSGTVCFFLLVDSSVFAFLLVFCLLPSRLRLRLLWSGVPRRFACPVRVCPRALRFSAPCVPAARVCGAFPSVSFVRTFFVRPGGGSSLLACSFCFCHARPSFVLAAPRGCYASCFLSLCFCAWFCVSWLLVGFLAVGLLFLRS